MAPTLSGSEAPVETMRLYLQHSIPLVESNARLFHRQHKEVMDSLFGGGEGNELLSFSL
jgi:hypothetical protein